MYSIAPEKQNNNLLAHFICSVNVALGTGTGSRPWVRVRVWVHTFIPGYGNNFVPGYGYGYGKAYGYGYYKSACCEGSDVARGGAGGAMAPPLIWSVG